MTEKRTLIIYLIASVTINNDYTFIIPQNAKIVKDKHKRRAHEKPRY